MNSSLVRHYNSLTLATKTLLKEIAPLSTSTYYFRPADDKWSISQILTHLLTSERLSLSYMMKKSQAAPAMLEKTGLREDILFFIFELSQQIPVKYKAPKVVLENTPEPLSFGDLVRQWEALRSEMLEFLNGLGPEKIDKKIYKHPIAGRLGVVHALRFMTLHLNHHRPQIKAIIVKQRGEKIPVA